MGNQLASLLTQAVVGIVPAIQDALGDGETGRHAVVVVVPVVVVLHGPIAIGGELAGGTARQ